jgi:hypothetical protein
VALALRHDLDREPRLVAYVVADGTGPPPTLARLRVALWADLPGTLWPAEAVVVDALVRRPDGTLDDTDLPPPGGGDDSPATDVLTAMWGEIAATTVGPRSSYWQDFSFLQVLAEARDAGLGVDDEQVSRCRTPEMLAVARAAGRRGPHR